MKRLMMALGTLVVLSAACKPLVINGGGGGSGGGTDPGPNATGGGPAVASNALAMRLADVPADVLAANTSGQAPTDPDTLVLFLSNEPETCAAPSPLSPGMGCATTVPLWQLALFIPPSLQGSGPIDLTNPAVFFHAGVVLPSTSNNQCAGGEGEGPGLSQGTLVIDSSNPDALTLTLSGGVTAMSEVVDGTYTAPVCQ
jgi:hypothetical protein